MYKLFVLRRKYKVLRNTYCDPLYLILTPSYFWKLLYHAVYWNSLAIYSEVIHNKFMLHKNKEKGFTLLELIIVVSIIAILSVLGISSYNSIQQDARNTKRKSDLVELQKALEAHKSRHGRYPSTMVGANRRWFGNCESSWNGSVVCCNTTSCPEGYIPGLAPTFINSLLEDPRHGRSNGTSAYEACRTNGNTVTYLYSSNGSEYKLLAHCGPEGTMKENDTFYDSVRPEHAWQISSSSVSVTW